MSRCLLNALAAVGVDGGEDCRVIIGAKEVLIERYLRRVLWIGLVEAVAIERAPALGIQRLAFPQARIGDIADPGAVDQNAVGVAG